MSANNNVAHKDAAVKGVAAGAVSYFANQYGLPAEISAALIPVVVVALSWVSTKIGDKNTALLFKLAEDAIKKAPAKKKAAPKKKA